MGAYGSKEKLSRSASDRYIQSQILEHERERFGRFGKRSRGGNETNTFKHNNLLFSFFVFQTYKYQLIFCNLLNLIRMRVCA